MEKNGFATHCNIRGLIPLLILLELLFLKSSGSSKNVNLGAIALMLKG